MAENIDKNTNSKRGTLIVTSVVAVVFLVASLFAFTSLNAKRITSENREYLIDNAVQVAASIDSAISDGYSNIKMLSDLVSESLTGPTFDVTQIQGNIQDSVFDFIEFADADGMDHNITGGVSDAHDRQYYLDAKAGNSGMELIYVSRATHETLLMFYAPMTYEGEFVGSLVGVYQASNRITKLLSSEYFGETATAYLATSEGRIIASNQGFDPQNEMYVTTLAGGSETLIKQFEAALNSSETFTFALPGNETGGCMVKLANNDMYLVQIFPPAASEQMIGDANRLGYLLVGFLALLFAVLLLILVKFYRGQQRQVEEARQQAEVASQAKTAFLFNMSHDIRTPMNAILGYTDIALRHQGDSARVNDSLRKIKTSGGHLLNLINDILEMSRIESGRFEITEVPMDIREAIKGVDHMGQSLALPKSIDFATVVGEISDPFIYADELHVNEVIINLISNAVKYTPDGGRVRYRVRQLSEVTDGVATFRFEVVDNGIGMSEEFQTHLFEAFARESSSTVSKTEGAGLGLSIVKKIVDDMGGTISVKSILSVGSTFIVELPFRVMDEQAAEEYASKADVEWAVYDGSLEGMRVLLVEDNEMNREIATEILEETGFMVETAEDGEIAVKAFAEFGPDFFDLILMDIQMPVMNGYEATAAIRDLPGGEKVPIIALSANAFEEDRQRSLEAGMNAHVAKPINVQELLEVLARFLK